MGLRGCCRPPPPARAAPARAREERTARTWDDCVQKCKRNAASCNTSNHVVVAVSDVPSVAERLAVAAELARPDTAMATRTVVFGVALVLLAHPRASSCQHESSAGGEGGDRRCAGHVDCGSQFYCTMSEECGPCRDEGEEMCAMYGDSIDGSCAVCTIATATAERRPKGRRARARAKVAAEGKGREQHAAWQAPEEHAVLAHVEAVAQRVAASVLAADGFHVEPGFLSGDLYADILASVEEFNLNGSRVGAVGHHSSVDIDESRRKAAITDLGAQFYEQSLPGPLHWLVGVLVPMMRFSFDRSTSRGLNGQWELQLLTYPADGGHYIAHFDACNPADCRAPTTRVSTLTHSLSHLLNLRLQSCSRLENVASDRRLTNVCLT